MYLVTRGSDTVVTEANSVVNKVEFKDGKVSKVTEVLGSELVDTPEADGATLLKTLPSCLVMFGLQHPRRMPRPGRQI